MKTVVELIQESGRWYGGINPANGRHGRIQGLSVFNISPKEILRAWWRVRNKTRRLLHQNLYSKNPFLRGLRIKRGAK